MVSEAGQALDEATIAGLCVEFWKLVRASSKTVPLLAETEARRFEAQVRFSERQLAALMVTLGMRIVEFDGELYEPGLAATADNADEFDEGTDLAVSRTLEPAVVRDMRVLKRGRVLVSMRTEGEE